MDRMLCSIRKVLPDDPVYQFVEIIPVQLQPEEVGFQSAHAQQVSHLLVEPVSRDLDLREQVAPLFRIELPGLQLQGIYRPDDSGNGGLEFMRKGIQHQVVQLQGLFPFLLLPGQVFQLPHPGGEHGIHHRDHEIHQEQQCIFGGGDLKGAQGADEKEVPDKGTQYRHHHYGQHPEKHGQQRDREQQQQSHHVVADIVDKEMRNQGNDENTAYSQEILVRGTLGIGLQEIHLRVFIKDMAKNKKRWLMGVVVCGLQSSVCSFGFAVLRFYVRWVRRLLRPL